MKKHLKQAICLNFLLLLNLNSAIGQSLEQIIEKHFKAVGMEYLKSVQTIQYKGTYYNRFLKKMGDNIPKKLLKPIFILVVDKEKSYRLQIQSSPGYIICGFHNGNYWINQSGNINESWNPSKADRRIINQYLDLEGYLYNSEKKGNRLSKLEDGFISNKLHYKIQLINTENDTSYYFIDTKTNLISYLSFDGDLLDGKKHQSIEFQKYKRIKNINIPFKRIHMEQMLDGTFDQKDVIIHSVKLNPMLIRDIFNFNNNGGNQTKFNSL